mmetsp:Transcript_13282/g.43271  ORF Transcript_13282/g.43271 Transcript_13282/m.43271 type:complete len:163 (+) Transcript_13282:176-664(+)
MVGTRSLVSLSLLFFVARQATEALLLSGVEVPHAKESGLSRCLSDGVKYPLASFFTEDELRPWDASNDQLFYLLPKFVQHADERARAGLTEYYRCALPAKGGAVLDLCSSWTSHYPPEAKKNFERCAVLGLNPLELLLNPSKTEWTVRLIPRSLQLSWRPPT